VVEVDVDRTLEVEVEGELDEGQGTESGVKMIMTQFNQPSGEIRTKGKEVWWGRW